MSYVQKMVYTLQTILRLCIVFSMKINGALIKLFNVLYIHIRTQNEQDSIYTLLGSLKGLLYFLVTVGNMCPHFKHNCHCNKAGRDINCSLQMFMYYNLKF